METEDRRAGVPMGNDQHRAVRGAAGHILRRTRQRSGDRKTPAAVFELSTTSEILLRVSSGDGDSVSYSVVCHAALLLPGRLCQAAVQGR